MMKKLCYVLGIVFLVLACKQEKNVIITPSSNSAVDSLFVAFYSFKKSINPIEATKAGYQKYNDTVANYISDDYQLHLKERYTYFLDALSAYDSLSVGAENWMSLKVMEWDCSIKLEGLMNPLTTIASPIYDLPNFELMPLFQIQSLHLYMAQLGAGSSVQPFKTEKDYSDWLERLEDYLAFLDTCIIKMEEGMAQGVVSPKVLTLKILPQVQAFIGVPLEDNLFYKPALNIPEAISEAKQDVIKKTYGDFISNKLVPKYKLLNNFLVDTYLPACRETDGIGDLPNGEATYDYLIRLHTTTNLTADEIHNLGLSEVARIREEMEKVKSEIGFKGDLISFFEFIRANENLKPFTKPEQVIANFNTIKKRIAIRLDSVFTSKPKAGFEVKRTEAFREASASAEYVPGSKDGIRSGTFYVPIQNVAEFNTLQNEALFLHEAIPGHHYQLSLQQENTNLPEFLHPESMGVFVEGWALYAESLGKELGLYEDPYQYFGMLSMEMHRAIRLVVDTGIHAKGWTREEAIAYSLNNEAESEICPIKSDN